MYYEEKSVRVELFDYYVVTHTHCTEVWSASTDDVQDVVMLFQSGFSSIIYETKHRLSRGLFIGEDADMCNQIYYCWLDWFLISVIRATSCFYSLQ